MLWPDIIVTMLLLDIVSIGEATSSAWVNPGYIHKKSRDKPKLLMLKKPFDWDKLDSDRLVVEFRNKKIYGDCKLDLYGYSESGQKLISKTKSPFVLLASGPVKIISKQREIDVRALDLKCREHNGGNTCEMYHMGYMELHCESSKEKLYSPVIPLGWFVHQHYKDSRRDDWAAAHCLNWFNKEDPKVRSAIRSLKCHPNKYYAEASSAEYSTMPEGAHQIAKFDMLSASGGGARIQPLQLCYHTTLESDVLDSNLHAAPTAECCYAGPNSMANENWVFLFKQTENPLQNFVLHGSTAYRSHPHGVDTMEVEYYLAGQVPYLSHWYWDLLPFRYCCLWWEGSGCSKYYQQARPTPKLDRSKNSFTSAYLVGNLMMQPLANQHGGSKPFMCSQQGDFWLFKTDKFRIQMQTGLIGKNVKPSAFLQRKDPRRTVAQSPFVTGLAFQVASLPHLTFQIIFSDQFYKYHMYVIDARTGQTEEIKTKSFGYVIFSEERHPSQKEDTWANDFIQSVYLTHKDEKVGIRIIFYNLGREFMNIMITTTKNIKKSIGLLGASVEGIPSGGLSRQRRGLAAGKSLFYADDKCESFRVASKDSLFADFTVEDSNKTTEGIPIDQNTPKLSIANMGLAKAKDITCMATNFKQYCKNVGDALTLMLYYEDLLRKHDGKQEQFRFCTKLPNVTGLLVAAIPQNSGLKAKDVLFMTCLKHFHPSNQGNFECISDVKGKTLKYGVGKNFNCKLNTDKEKADKKAIDYYRSLAAGTKFGQHQETHGGLPKDGNDWHGTRKFMRRGDDEDGAASLRMDVAILLAAALCLLFSHTVLPQFLLS